MTCNQLMVLLDFYRGTFKSDRHMGTVVGDINQLQDYNYIMVYDKKTEITKLGISFVKSILRKQT